MAIWQFDLSFIPSGDPLPSRSGEGFDVPSLTEERALEAHAYLSKYLGEPWLMLEDGLVFGEEQGHRVDLVRTENGGAEVSARIDARGSVEQFCNAVCELARALDCLLFSPEFWLAFQAEPALLAAALEKSRASAFVRNPLQVLRGSEK